MSSDTNAKDENHSLEITTSPSEEQLRSLAGTIPPSCQVCGRLLNDQGSTQQQLGQECANLSATVLQVIVTEKHWTLEQIANLYSSTPAIIVQKLHELGMDVQEQQNVRTKSAAHTRKKSSGGIHTTKRNKIIHNSKGFNKNPTSDPHVRNATKRKGINKTNTLALRYPELAKEWHPTKNGNLTPDQVTIGSGYKAWWQCSRNPKHEWPATVKDRVHGYGCSFCTGRKADESNNLLVLRPDLAKEWHPTKNGSLTPNQVTTKSNKKVWWQCSVNLKHEWPATVKDRVRGHGCSFCTGRKADESNNLLVLRPDLAKEWHPTKNGSLTPDQVTIGSGYKAWWQCSRNSKHEWPAIVSSRVYGNGCSLCSGRKVDETNSLLTLRPDLAKEWHPTKNGNLTPNQVTIGSNRKVWWQCSVNPKHEWPATVKKRTHGHGCSLCSGRKVGETNSLLALRPDLAKEWHPTKNGSLTPDQVTTKSHKKVWWQCSRNSKHEWPAIVSSRVYGNGCSLCSGRKVDETNSLLTLRPDLAKEWHPTKNGNLTPNQVTTKSNRKVWWQCSVNSKHEWPATVKNRSLGSGCPTCNDININEKWYPWEQFCDKLGRILYPSTFRAQPSTRLPNNKLPDFSYQDEHNEVIIVDAKTHCWIPEIENSISNYLPYCTQLEFWCLEKKRDPEIRNGKVIIFLAPEDLLAKVSDKQLQHELQKEIQKILEDTQLPMKSLGTFI